MLGAIEGFQAAFVFVFAALFVLYAFIAAFTSIRQRVECAGVEIVAVICKERKSC